MSILSQTPSKYFRLYESLRLPSSEIDFESCPRQVKKQKKPNMAIVSLFISSNLQGNGQKEVLRQKTLNSASYFGMTEIGKVVQLQVVSFSIESPAHSLFVLNTILFLRTPQGFFSPCSFDTERNTMSQFFE